MLNIFIIYRLIHVYIQTLWPQRTLVTDPKRDQTALKGYVFCKKNK